MRSAALAALCVLVVGCTPGKPAPLPSDQGSMAPTRTSASASQSSIDTASPVSTRVQAETVTPDPAIQAGMRCDPLAAGTRSRVEQLWGDPVGEAVQVEIGFGNDPDELWWVVAYTSPGTPDPILRLTNQPSDPASRGTWIVLGSTDSEGRYLWDNVHWDVEQLSRGQSALSKAIGCLQSE